MSPSSPAWAAETELIRRLETEWRTLAHSRWLRKHLQAWAAEDDRLALELPLLAGHVGYAARVLVV